MYGKGSVISDWSKVDLNTPLGRRAFIGALTHYMQGPTKDNDMTAALGQVLQDPKVIQHFTTAGDFPDPVLRMLAKYNQVPAYDTGYERVFDIRDYTNSDRSGFLISDVTEGLTFDEIPIGQKVDIYKFTGTRTQINFVRYGGGLGIDRTMLDDREWLAVEDQVVAFRNNAYFKRASVFYALIEALSATYNVTWQAVTPTNLPNTDANYDAIRDMNTINESCRQIINACEALGLGISMQTNFVLLCPLQLYARMRRAVGVLNAGIAGTSFQGLNWNIDIVVTNMLATTTSYYVIAPKAKLKGGIRQELSVFGSFDPESYTDIAVGWMRFGGALAEPRQLRRCAVS